MKNWFPFPMTSKGKTFMKGKCAALSRRHWKKTSSNIWKHCDRNNGSINFSHSFLLIIAYLIIEVAAFQQNMGRKGFFWHIDSLHYDANFTLNGDRNNYCWEDARVPSLSRPDGKFGDYNCDSSYELISSVLQFMKAKMGDNIDFILWTGNSIPQSPNFPLDNQTARDHIMEKVTDMFRHTFPYTTIYPSLGNLDITSSSMLNTRFPKPGSPYHRSRRPKGFKRNGHRRRGNKARADIPSALSWTKHAYSRAADLWQTWLPPKAVDSLRKGGYYNIELAGRRLRLISLNMNIYLEDIADELSYHERSSSLSQGLLRSSKHQQSTSDHRIRHNFQSRKSDKNPFMSSEQTRASRKRVKSSDNSEIPSMQSNPTSSWVSDPEEQWDWLHRVMEEARRKEQNVILFGHSPPGKYERSSAKEFPSGNNRANKPVHRGQHWLQEKYNRRYLEFVRRYSDIIVGQFFGHQHSDSFRVFKDKNGKPISWAFLNPSVSPFRSSSNGLNVESSNPAVRLYRYDSYTGKVLDYAQYYLDLKTANKEVSSKSDGSESHTIIRQKADIYTKNHRFKEDSPSPLTLIQQQEQQQRQKYGMRNYNGRNHHGMSSNINSGYDSISYDDALVEENNKKLLNRNKNFWRIEYNFTSLYRMPGISADTLDHLSHKLQTNRSWFDIYFRTNNVNLNGDPSKQCPDVDCRRVQNCAISHVDYAEYQYCVERGDGFGDNDIVGLAYDITSDASRNVKMISFGFRFFIDINVSIVYLVVLIHCIPYRRAFRN